MKRLVTLLMVLLLCSVLFAEGTAELTESNAGRKIPIRVLILPKLEVGEMSGDFPGEAQYFYDEYVKGGQEYEIRGAFEGNKLYVKDNVALYVTGMGKVNSTISTLSILMDDRFDFSDAYVISVGSAGSATINTVMGDVFIITTAIDYDLGHHADPRDLADINDPTWFHDDSYDSSSVIYLSKPLTDRAFELVENTKLETTEKTRKFMSAAFNGTPWAVRDPQVMKGTIVTTDNFWKGEYNQRTAIQMTEEYGCPDPYVCSDMEDVAIGVVLKRVGMLDRFLIVRSSVNMDVFMLGATPESLWGKEKILQPAESEVESADIFATAMESDFKVGRIIIDAILNGTF